MARATSLRPHPGPCLDISVDFFYPPPPPPGAEDAVDEKANPKKRPAGPLIQTPAKRRILETEGLLSPSNVKSPLSSLKGNGRIAHDHFNALVQGPDSPAKQLDFGGSKTPSRASSVKEQVPATGGKSNQATPRRKPPASTTKTPRRSVRIASQSSTSGSAPSTPGPSTPSTNVPALDTYQFESYYAAVTQISVSHLHVAAPSPQPFVPEPANPSSDHYPGFEVFNDAEGKSSVSGDFDMDVDGPDEEEDIVKENVCPPPVSPRETKSLSRRTSPLGTPEATPRAAPAITPIDFMTPAKVPRSPHPKHVSNSIFPSTPRTGKAPRFAVPAMPHLGVSPACKLARQVLRRQMEEEVDGEDDEF